MGSTYECMVSGESMPSLGTIQLQHMHTAVPAKTDDIMEHVQTSHDVITYVTTQVL